MNSVTTNNKDVQSQSPLSSFLSNLIDEQFGLTNPKSQIVVDNHVSHSPTRAGPSSPRSQHNDSESVARTISSSSSSLSSSRWDPNILPLPNKKKRNTGLQDPTPYKSKPHSFELSPGAPVVPLRRQSPEVWSRKQKTAMMSPSKQFMVQSTLISSATGNASFVGLDFSDALLPPPYPVRQVSLPPCDLFVSRSEPDLSQIAIEKVQTPFGSKDSLSESALLPPPFPIRQVSLPSSDLFPSRSEPNLAHLSKSPKKLKIQQEKVMPNDPMSMISSEISMSIIKAELSRSTKNKSNKKKKAKKSKGEGKKKKKKPSFLQSPRSPPSAPTSSVQSSPRSPTKLYRYLRSSLSPKKKAKNLSSPRLLSPTLLSPKKSRSRTPNSRSSRTPSSRELFASTPPSIRKRDNALREAFRSSGIPDRLPFPIIEDEENVVSGENADKKPQAVNRCHRRPKLSRRSRTKPSPDEFDECSPRSTIQEGRSLVSALTSLPSHGKSLSPTKKVRFKIPISSNQPRSLMESHRSLSATLLSCDRDEPNSPGALSATSTTARRGKRYNRQHKRAPPVRPVRQLSRALLEL